MDRKPSYWHKICFNNRNDEFVASISDLLACPDINDERQAISDWAKHGGGDKKAAIVSARAGSGKTQLIANIYKMLCPNLL